MARLLDPTFGDGSAHLPAVWRRLMRVYEGQQCPVCRRGTVRRAYSDAYGEFLGCSTFDYGRGDRSAWNLDGTRLNSGGSVSTQDSSGVPVAVIVIGAVILLIIVIGLL